MSSKNALEMGRRVKHNPSCHPDDSDVEEAATLEEDRFREYLDHEREEVMFWQPSREEEERGRWPDEERDVVDDRLQEEIKKNTDELLTVRNQLRDKKRKLTTVRDETRVLDNELANLRLKERDLIQSGKNLLRCRYWLYSL